jgi:hypothetical protein
VIDHDDAVNAALLALAHAQLDSMGEFPGGHPTSEEYLATAKWILEQIRVDGQIEFRAPQSAMLPADALLRLVADAIGLPSLQDALARERSELDGLWETWKQARDVDMKRPTETHHQRAHAALFRLGLVGKRGGEGKTKRDNRLIVMTYNTLRVGGHVFNGDGILERVETHDRAAAVAKIEEWYSISWDSFTRDCRRKRIHIPDDEEIRLERIVRDREMSRNRASNRTNS